MQNRRARSHSLERRRAASAPPAADLETSSSSSSSSLALPRAISNWFGRHKASLKMQRGGEPFETSLLERFYYGLLGLVVRMLILQPIAFLTNQSFADNPHVRSCFRETPSNSFWYCVKSLFMWHNDRFVFVLFCFVSLFSSHSLNQSIYILTQSLHP